MSAPTLKELLDELIAAHNVVGLDRKWHARQIAARTSIESLFQSLTEERDADRQVIQGWRNTFRKVRNGDWDIIESLEREVAALREDAQRLKRDLEEANRQLEETVE